MTYAVSSVPLTSKALLLTPQCAWYRRLLPLCNGERTVQDIAHALHLPTQVVLKLMDRAVSQGWLEPPPEIPHTSDQKSDCYRALQGELNILLGDRGNELLGQAVQMTRVSPAELTSRHVTDVLIALELCLPREQAEAFGPQFDALRDAYAC